MRHRPRALRPLRTGSVRRFGHRMALACALSLLAGLAGAQIYRWTDREGSVHFTDNLQAVPPEYRGRASTLDDRLPPPSPPVHIPLEASDLGYLVTARINGSLPVRLVLDTGASGTVLSAEAARSLGLDVRRDPPVRLRTANGEVNAGWAEVDEIEVGGRRHGPLRVVIHDAVPGADGLLGMNFLGAFRVEIDASAPALILSTP